MGMSPAGREARIRVESMGGPLIVVPVSGLSRWQGATESGNAAGSGEVHDDYDRACEVDGWAGVIAVGGRAGQGLVLADEPARTCFLAEERAFVRWWGADSESDLIAAARSLLAGPATGWEECGVWATDGPAVLMDSVTAGVDLTVEYPNGGGLPDQAPVAIASGSWTVQAAATAPAEYVSVGVIRLVPRSPDSSCPRRPGCRDRRRHGRRTGLIVPATIRLPGPPWARAAGRAPAGRVRPAPRWGRWCGGRWRPGRGRRR